VKWGIVRKLSNRIHFAVPTVLLAVVTACQNLPNETAKPATTLHNLSSEDVASRTIQRRAVEAVIWSTPAVNFDRMDQAMVNDAKAGEGNNNL
jgi:hypothetical protein